MIPRRGRPWLLWAVAWATFLSPLAAAEPRPPVLLTNAAAIKALGEAEAAQKLPIRVQGVVLMSPGSTGDLFVQDDTDAFYVAPATGTEGLRAGDRVEIEGITDPGGYAPMVMATSVRRLGPGELPPPRPASCRQLNQGHNDAQYVSVEGTVLAFQRLTEGILLTLYDETGSSEAFVRLPVGGNVPDGLGGARVRARGVSAPAFNRQRQATRGYLAVAGLDQLDILTRGRGNPFVVKPTPIGRLGRFHAGSPATPSLKVQGVVTAVPASTEVFLQDDTGGVRARFTRQVAFAPGTRLEILGQSQVDGTDLILRAHQWREAGTQALPDAPQVGAQALAQPELFNRRITLEGRVLAVSRSLSSDRTEISLALGDLVVLLSVPPPPEAAALPLPGSQARATGVLQYEQSGRDQMENPRLYLAEWKALEITAPPPRSWTRTIRVAGLGAGAAALLALGWATTLRRRVAARTAELTAANSRLQDEASRRAEVEANLRVAQAALNRSLEEVQQKNESLQLAHARALRLAEEAGAASRAKSDFLATVSHEIRTPLNGVLGMGRLLLESPLKPSQRDMADTILKSGEALLELVNQILDFSRTETGRLELESRNFRLPDLLDEVISFLRPEAQARQLSLELRLNSATPTVLQGDPGRLRQVLINLVGNAIKFTHQGAVRVEVQPLESLPDRPRLRFDVVDTGIGIAAADQARIFEPFVQVDSSTTREYGGTGLGLAIVRQLVQRMDGGIHVESSPGEGSRFWFTATFQSPSAAPPPAKPALPVEWAPMVGPDGQPPRILVAEDQPINRRVLALQLARLGCTATMAGSGLEVLEAIARSPIDVVLMDCHMPGLDGYETARRLKAPETRIAGGRCPWLIAVTANAQPEERERCLAAGLDDFLAKPLSVGDLQAALTRGLQARNSRP